MRKPRSSHAAAALVALSATVLAGPALAASLSGTALYRERIALPPDAVFEVRLQDVSLADAPAPVLARFERDPAGQPPFHFKLNYDERQIDPKRRYSISASVRQRGRLLFITDTHIAAFETAQPLRLLMVSAGGDGGGDGGGGPPMATPPDSPLRGTYWKLVRLQGAPVGVAEQQREPHLIFAANEPRLSGSGGCNNVMGGFETGAGQQLRFKTMASTMMACTAGMAQETQFLRALEGVASYRIGGGRLELLDAGQAVLASFEAVALRR